MRILLIEDNIDLSENIKIILENERFTVDTAEDGDKGYELLLINDYDLLILDIMLPKMDGFTILEYARTNEIKTPILVLSAKSEVEDKVKALNSGSDDYLTKPFAKAELIARVRSILRRKYDFYKNAIEIADLKIDLNLKEVYRASRKIELTPKEYELLEFLAHNKGKVISRYDLGEHVWGETFDYSLMSNFIDVHIRHLRKKIDDNSNIKLIHTKRGVGYYLDDKENSC